MPLQKLWDLFMLVLRVFEFFNENHAICLNWAEPGKAEPSGWKESAPRRLNKSRKKT